MKTRASRRILLIGVGFVAFTGLPMVLWGGSGERKGVPVAFQEAAGEAVTGSSVYLVPGSGTVRIKLPGSSEFIVLEEARLVPVGTIVDTTDGEVQMYSSSGPAPGGTTTTSNGAGPTGPPKSDDQDDEDETVPTQTVTTQTTPPETVPTETIPTETVPTETIPTDTGPIDSFAKPSDSQQGSAAPKEMLGPEAAVAAPPAADRVSALSRGVFQVLQASFDGAPTVIKLVGALDGCKKADGGESHDPHRAGRQVWAHGRGVHTTVGHLSSATVRGTNWRVRDRCDGSTWTQVIHGIVEVKDDATGQIVTLTAGEGHAAGP